MHKFVERDVQGQFGKDLLVIDAELRQDDSRLANGFAIGAHLYEARRNASGRRRRDWEAYPDMVGCLHDQILAAAPELAPLVAVHLSDLNGVPMHAVANGWYFYSGNARAWEEARGQWRGVSDHDRAARALHIPPADLPEYLSHSGFVEFAESLRPVWEQQAAAARELLEAL